MSGIFGAHQATPVVQQVPPDPQTSAMEQRILSQLQNLNEGSKKNTNPAPQTFPDLETSLPSNSPSPVAPFKTAVPPLAATPVTVELDSCGEINKPGRYVLDGDIVSPEGKSCIEIHDTTNVYIDCAGHLVSSDIGFNAVSFDRVRDFSLSSCVLKNKTAAPPEDTWSNALSVSNSENGTIEKNTFSVSTFASIRASSNIKVVGNSMYSQFLVASSKQTLIQNNNFVFTPTVNQKGIGTLLNLTKGSYNKVIGNTFDGGSDGIAKINIDDEIGADDSITMSDESGDTFENNDIKNNWDCGIENTGFLFDSKIINNRITNAGVCAIGGWYSNSLKGNLIKNNIASDVPQLFIYYRVYGLQSGEQYVYFKDNTFENNVLRNPRISETNVVGRASKIIFEDAFVARSKLVLGNNVFINNDFSKVLAPPDLKPETMIVDGGGNICAPAEDIHFPLNCN